MPDFRNIQEQTWQPYLLSAILSEDEDPEAAGEEEEDRHQDVQGGQGHLSRTMWDHTALKFALKGWLPLVKLIYEF